MIKAGMGWFSKAETTLTAVTIGSAPKVKPATASVSSGKRENKSFPTPKAPSALKVTCLPLR